MEYQQATVDEEVFFSQKAKVKWLNEGDGNTKFFHNVVKETKSMFFISSICDLHGAFHYDDDVSRVFMEYFRDILEVVDVNVNPIMPEDIFNRKLSLSDTLHVIRPFSDEEIKQEMFSIGNDKAPRSDGFSSLFLKNN